MNMSTAFSPMAQKIAQSRMIDAISACGNGAAGEVFLHTLQIDTWPPRCPSSLSILSISDTLLRNLDGCPANIKVLQIGGFHNDFYLRGTAEHIEHLYISGSNIPNAVVHFAGMPHIERITFLITDDIGSRIYPAYKLNLEGLEFDFTRPPIKVHGYGPHIEMFTQYYNQMKYKYDALHGSNDEAGLSNILNSYSNE